MPKNIDGIFTEYLLQCGSKKIKLTPDRIRSIRKYFKLTQVAFSEFIMVGYETYRSWEEGRRYPSSPGYAILLIAEKYPGIFIKNREDLIKEFQSLSTQNEW